MKYLISLLFVSTIMLFRPIVVQSQNNSCTREAVASSYAQAVAAGTDLNQWYQTTYTNSGCPEAILSFASSLAYTQLPANAPTSQPAQSEDSPPAGLKLPGPGTYLFTNGKLVRLSITQSEDFSKLPQTSNLFPSVLYWSTDTSNNSLFPVNTVFYLKGGIGVTLGSVSGHVVITSVTPNSPAFNTGLQYGDRIVSINGVQVGDSIDQAIELLGGEIGTPVEISILRGTQNYTLTIVRGAVSPQTSTWPYDSWDATTIILKPDNPLPPGIYCVGEGCFRVVADVSNDVNPDVLTLSAQEQDTLRVGTYNINDGYDSNQNDNLEEIAQTILSSGADVVLLQELNATQAQLLAQRLGMQVRFFSVSSSGEGLAVLSYKEIVFDEGVVLSTVSGYSGALQRVQVRSDEGLITLYNVWLGQSLEPTNGQQTLGYEQLLDDIFSILNNDFPDGNPVRTIFGGTFNRSPSSPLIQSLQMAGFRDPFTGWSEADVFTFQHGSFQDRFDYLWLYRPWQSSGVKVMESQASDHRMVVTEVLLRDVPSAESAVPTELSMTPTPNPTEISQNSSQANVGQSARIILSPVPPSGAFSSDDLSNTANTVAKRLNALGISNPTVEIAGNGNLIIEVSGVPDVQAVTDTIQQTALLEFVDFSGLASESATYLGHKITTDTQTQIAERLSLQIDPTSLMNPSTSQPFHTILTGAGLQSATATQLQNGQWGIQFAFTADGGKVMGPFSAAVIGQPIAIVLDGMVLSMPIIQARLDSGGVIAGNFDEAKAKQLALQIRSGALATR